MRIWGKGFVLSVCLPLALYSISKLRQEKCSLPRNKMSSGPRPPVETERRHWVRRASELGVRRDTPCPRYLLASTLRLLRAEKSSEAGNVDMTSVPSSGGKCKEPWEDQIQSNQIELIRQKLNLSKMSLLFAIIVIQAK